MTRSLQRAFGRAAEGAQRAVVSTPVEVAIGVAMAVALSVGIAVDDPDVSKRTTEAVLAGLVGLVGTFATSALHRLGAIGGGTRWLATGAMVAGAALYGWLLLDLDRLAEVWRWGLLASGLALATMLVPLAAPEPDAGRRVLLWRFDVRLLVRVLATGLYTAVMYAGLALAILAVDALFELDLDNELYAHLASAIFVAGGTWIVVAGLPELTEAETPLDPRAARLAARFGRWLFAPLLVVYLGIIYAYVARMLVTGQVPSNVLSPLALGAAALGLLASVVVDPVHHSPDHRILAAATRWFPVVYLPLVPLPAWAVWERIAQYGWTEFRYVRLLAVAGVAVCFALAAMQLARRRPTPMPVYPAVFAAVLLLASVGPWGAVAVTEQSQRSRLTRELREAGLLENGRIDVAEAKSKPPASTSPLRSRVVYLIDHHGWSALASLVPASVEVQERDRGWSVAVALGLGPRASPRSPRTPVVAHPRGPFALDGPGRLHRVSVPGRASGTDEPFEAELNGRVLRLEHEGGAVWVAALDGVLARIDGASAGDHDGPVRLPARLMSAEVRDEEGAVRGRVLLERADMLTADEPRFIHLEALVWIPDRGP